MCYRRPLLARIRGQAGAGATEYLILFVLAAIAVIALYGKYGKKVGGNVHGSGKRVAALGEEQGGRTAERAASSGSTGGEQAGPSTVGGSNPSLDALPEPVAAGGSAEKTGDTKIVILLGIVALAVGALMILTIFQRVRKAQKRARLQR